ncbi:MAG: enoyl-CoA hydratase/isomerase family protein [Kouleothrix sp.]
MTDMPLTYTLDGNVGVITLNRPDKLTALTPAMMQELNRLLDQINSDDEVRCPVLTGAMSAFSRLRPGWAADARPRPS